jgi:hypothetical protein
MRALRVMIFLVAGIFATQFCYGLDSADAKWIAFAGAGVTNQSAAAKGSVHFGAAFEWAPPLKLLDFSMPGYQFEGGYVGPANNFGSGSALFSANYVRAFHITKADRFILSATGGYTQLFGTGNAMNFGVGFDIRPNQNSAIRIEIRDYLRTSSFKEHNAAIRVGLIGYICD